MQTCICMSAHNLCRSEWKLLMCWAFKHAHTFTSHERLRLLLLLLLLIHTLTECWEQCKGETENNSELLMSVTLSQTWLLREFSMLILTQIYSSLICVYNVRARCTRHCTYESDESNCCVSTFGSILLAATVDFVVFFSFLIFGTGKNSLCSS